MKILTYQTKAGGQRLGALSPDERHVIDLSTLAPDAIALLEGGEQAIDAAREHLAITPQENWTELEQVTLCSPVPRPGTIRETMCFEAHIINCIRLRMGPLGPLDERLARLVGTRRSLAGRLNSSFYQRPPYYKTNPRSVVGTDTDVRIPPYTKQFDYELSGASTSASRAQTSRSTVHTSTSAATRSSTISRPATPSSTRCVGAWVPPRARTSTPGTRSAHGSSPRTRSRPLQAHHDRPRRRRGVVARELRRDLRPIRRAHRLHVPLRDALPRRLHRLRHLLRQTRQGVRTRARTIPHRRQHRRTRGRAHWRPAQPGDLKHEPWTTCPKKLSQSFVRPSGAWRGRGCGFGWTCLGGGGDDCRFRPKRVRAQLRSRGLSGNLVHSAGTARWRFAPASPPASRSRVPAPVVPTSGRERAADFRWPASVTARLHCARLPA